MNLSLHFDKGTLLLYGAEEEQLALLEAVDWDERTQCYRAPAAEYRRLVTTLREQKIPFQDHARKFSAESFPLKKKDFCTLLSAGGRGYMDDGTARCCGIADRSR